MATESSSKVTAKKVPPNRELTVMVDGKILNRFESFNISHSIDITPMSFSLVYGMDNGESDNTLNVSNIVSSVTSISKNKNVPDNQQVIGLLGVGQKIEIYLEKQHVFTGYIESVNESYSYGEHKLYIDGRSLVSPIVDSTTNKPSGMLPTSISTLKDLADYMFGDFGIVTNDKTYGDTKFQMANLLQIDLTTKPFDYVSTMAQYEGKLLYDNEMGQMIIDDVATDKSDNPPPDEIHGYTYLGKDADGIMEYDATGTMKPFDCITDDNCQFEMITAHKTTLGRYRNYNCVIGVFGGPPGIPNILSDIPTSQDKSPNELPPGKNLTIVSQMAYPSNGDTNGLLQFQNALMQYTANVNWGRGQTISATATGYLNPVTKKLWRINTYAKFKMDKPSIEGGFVVQSLNFYIDEYGGRKTDIVFVPPEALQVAPIAITPLIMMNGASNNDQNSSNSATVAQQKPVDVTAPSNAKPNTTS